MRVDLSLLHLIMNIEQTILVVVTLVLTLEAPATVVEAVDILASSQDQSHMVIQSSLLEAVVVDQVTLLTVAVAVGHQAEMLVTAALVAVVEHHRMVVDLLVTLVLMAAQVLN